jgi:hypothetical protein
MGILGYLPQVICEITLHFGSKTMGVLRNGWAMAGRVKEETGQTKISSTQALLHQIADSLAFHARAGGLEFGHHVLHHGAHIFQGW